MLATDSSAAFRQLLDEIHDFESNLVQEGLATSTTRLLHARRRLSKDLEPQQAALMRQQWKTNLTDAADQDLEPSGVLAASQLYSDMRTALLRFEELTAYDAPAQQRAFYSCLRALLTHAVKEQSEDQRHLRVGAAYQWFIHHSPSSQTSPPVPPHSHANPSAAAPPAPTPSAPSHLHLAPSAQQRPQWSAHFVKPGPEQLHGRHLEDTAGYLPPTLACFDAAPPMSNTAPAANQPRQQSLPRSASRERDPAAHSSLMGRLRAAGEGASKVAPAPRSPTMARQDGSNLSAGQQPDSQTAKQPGQTVKPSALSALDSRVSRVSSASKQRPAAAAALAAAPSMEAQLLQGILQGGLKDYFREGEGAEADEGEEGRVGSVSSRGVQMVANARGAVQATYGGGGEGTGKVAEEDEGAELEKLRRKWADIEVQQQRCEQDVKAKVVEWSLARGRVEEEMSRRQEARRYGNPRLGVAGGAPLSMAPQGEEVEEMRRRGFLSAYAAVKQVYTNVEGVKEFREQLGKQYEHDAARLAGRLAAAGHGVSQETLDHALKPVPDRPFLTCVAHLPRPGSGTARGSEKPAVGPSKDQNKQKIAVKTKTGKSSPSRKQR